MTSYSLDASRRAVRGLALALALSACGDGAPQPTTTTTTPVIPPVTLPTAASLTVKGGDSQTGAVNSALANTLTVKALSSSNVPVAGAEVNFVVMAGAATVAPATALTDASGLASTKVTLGTTAGPVQVNATVKGTALTATFRATSIIPEPDSTSTATVYNPDWTEATHGKVTPNYAAVFPQAAVNTIEITMTTTNWASIRANMVTLYGYDFGGRAGGAGAFPEDDPDYVALTIKHNGKLWKKVGFRLKGNSTLATAWASGNYKLPFRLKMNEWEDTYPAIKNQRFFGFKEMSFSPGRSDPSLIREKSSADILRLAGVPSAQTAFYRVFIDFGVGLKYCGVYTMVEVIDDTMVKDQFGEDKGNIYKPESALRVFIEGDFEKKNNKTSDYSDVQAAITALNNPLRLTNAAQWRANLEAVFNVDHFLKWLAANNAIVNWDSYGAIGHNYYLYNSPTKKLMWIPWDHNEAMTGSPGITATVGGAPGSMANRGLSLSMNEVSASWPLIRFLIDDAVYAAQYKAHLKAFNTNVLVLANVNAMFDKYTALIAPFVVGANGEQPGYTYTSAGAFTQALPDLKAHIQNRKTLVSTYVP
ncbi:MAG: CotH kinase family protein [Gemmatimonadota bacterium]